MRNNVSGRSRKRKRRIKKILEDRRVPDHGGAVFHAQNIDYDVSDRIDGLACGGIGAIMQTVQSLGLADAIDRRLGILKIYNPYTESDHVLNIAFNLLAGGQVLDDLERLRNDEVYSNALEAVRIPDPTTAGDFCRRFDSHHILTLMNVINSIRLKVWRQQPDSFFDEAIIDVDGTHVPTYGECKEGVELAYTGEWCYHPLVVSLANTGEVLFIVNRSGARPSHEGAAEYLDMAAELCERAGFRRITFRGDTDFSQTAHLDRWDAKGYRFIFGMDANATLVERSEDIPEEWWYPLDRAKEATGKTRSRRRPENVKARIVKEKELLNLRLNGEDVGEFDYQPGKCSAAYQVVALRKNISRQKGELMLVDEIRYFFYITNDTTLATEADIVRKANGRCNQENLIDQLKNGVPALRAPLGDLASNWAYMVMASLGWTFKVWFALLLPESGRWGEKYREEKQSVLKMEFKKFLNVFMLVPCQLVRQGRKLIYRLLSWNVWQEVLLRYVNAVRLPIRC